jgi:hypothetical protein
VQIFEDDGDRLHLALAEEQPPDGIDGLLPALDGIESAPLLLVHGHVEEREQCRHGGLQRSVEGEQLADDLLADVPAVVRLTESEVRFQEVNDRQVRRGLAVRDRSGLEDEPPVGAVKVQELPVQARLADAGLAHDGHHLTAAGPRLLERLPQLGQLAVPAHETREPAGRARLKA